MRAAAGPALFARWVDEARVRNTRRYLEKIVADPRYAAAANQKPPTKIGTRLWLFECITCDKCKDDRRDKPWMGLDIVRGMKRDGMDYKDGTILDQRNGNVYNAKMTLKPDGQTLVVRGYLGISLFGQDRIWTRLPDTAYNEIDPRFNPNPPAASKKAGAMKQH